jgi:hypothetical protein
MAHTVTELKGTLSKLLPAHQDRTNRTGPLSTTGLLMGNDARLAIMARTVGLRLVWLLNSGFYVLVRPLLMDELSSFIQQVDTERRTEVGRVLGYHFNMVYDHYIKTRFMKLAESMIVDSNLAGWREPGVLQSAISFHDYGTMLHAACCLQYPKGYKISLACANQECRYVEHEYKVDLNEMKVADYTRLPEAAIPFLVMKPVALSDVRQYQTELLKRDRVIRNDILEFHLQVPSFNDVAFNSSEFMAMLLADLGSELRTGDDKVNQKITTNIYHSLIPWVKKVVVYSGPEKDAKPVFTAIDRPGITQALESAAMMEPEKKEDRVYYQISKYIAETQIMAFGYQGMKCPKCAQEPETAYRSFVPVDLQTVFFYLSCRRLQLR